MRLYQYILTGAVLTAGALGLKSCFKTQAETVDTEALLTYCSDKVDRAINSLSKEQGVIDYTKMPRNIALDSMVWSTRDVCPEEWCDGFWPGVLWYTYEYSGKKEHQRQAELFTDQLQSIIEHPVYDHDLGFLFFPSYGNGYRLTHNPEYRKVLLNAADSLATLYNPNVGTLLAWPRNIEMFGGHNTIMDTMMNLELLFWASKNGGSQSLYDMAVKHAETTMRHHFRNDYSCYHVAVYNPESGEFIRGCNHQGYADDSSWARGQAWAIYGFTVVYRETQDARFLDFVQKVADNYLSRLPEDLIPYWDFDAPDIPKAPRDASAACVVASALLELSEYVEKPKAEQYRGLASNMLANLSNDHYKSGAKNDAFLMHSTGNMPAGSEIDASIIYADYYYIEALLRLKKATNP